MPGVRLYPNYHGYNSTTPCSRKLLTLAADAKLVGAASSRGWRTSGRSTPSCRSRRSNSARCRSSSPESPGLKVQVLNSMAEPRTETLVPFARAGEVYFDFAMLEAVGCVSRLVDRVGADRVLFGSCFPLFHAEAAHLKVKESALPADVAKKVFADNTGAIVPKEPR